jgi:hypothetical protein
MGLVCARAAPRDDPQKERTSFERGLSCALPTAHEEGSRARLFHGP